MRACNEKSSYLCKIQFPQAMRRVHERQLEICHKFAEDNDYEGIAEYYSAELSEKVTSGM